MNPHAVTRDLEAALAAYTGAPYAVCVSSCTMALLLACRWQVKHGRNQVGNCDVEQVTSSRAPGDPWQRLVPRFEIPKRTYVSVPQSIIHAGGRVTFRDDEWRGAYQLKPHAIWDSARWLTKDLYPVVTLAMGEGYTPKGFVCVSFHASKTLGDTQGGAILHDDPAADAWFRRARFDGRREGVAPADDEFDMVGYHCYLSPDVSARLLWQLSVLREHNAPLPCDDYPDLSRFEVFR